MSVFLFLGKELKKYYHSISDTLITDSGRQYEVTDRICAGGNGVVHKCLDSITGDEYAIKFQLDLRDSRPKRFLLEKRLLKIVHHEHLVTYIDQGEAEGTKFSFKKQSAERIPYLIMELAENSLFNQIKNQELKINEDIYLAQFRGLSKALANIHVHAIHRDIKPDNILISGDRWLLSDYGLCTFLDDNEEHLTRIDEVVGPRFWMSPEANNRNVGGKDEINKSSDVFQLASVFWFVVNKTHPTGVLTKNDWTGPERLFEPIFKALHYDKQIRPIDGAEFAQQIESAILS